MKCSRGHGRSLSLPTSLLFFVCSTCHIAGQVDGVHGAAANDDMFEDTVPASRQHQVFFRRVTFGKHVGTRYIQLLGTMAVCTRIGISRRGTMILRVRRPWKVSMHTAGIISAHSFST